MVRILLRELLEKNEKSVYWLANETGIHYNNITNIVKNKTKSIKYENIEKFCEVFNCTPNDLFEIIKTP